MSQKVYKRLTWFFNLPNVKVNTIHFEINLNGGIQMRVQGFKKKKKMVRFIIWNKNLKFTY